MKPASNFSFILVLILSAICSIIPNAVNAAPVTTPSGTYPAIGDSLKGSKQEKIIKFNSAPENKKDQITSVDSTRYNIFGNLLKDDPRYNKKYPIWRPMAAIVEQHVVLNLFDRYVLNEDFAKVSLNSWKHNLKTGWVWDKDRFGMNFLFHPFGGGGQFAAARSYGYNYWESLPYAIGGSALWEYFGETSLPSINDEINTPISGAFFGEVMYRLSSNVLDDRATGSNRFFREAAAGLISPTRFVSRIMTGKFSRVTTQEVYQKEPINIELSAGERQVNNGRSFGTGPRNILISSKFDYGYPFEDREWKPFDYFNIRLGLNVGTGRKIVENITGYGVLAGKTVHTGKLEMLEGLFQHYNYFDNKTFELGTMAFGGGLMTRYPLSETTFLYSNFHLSAMPFAGNSTRLGPDTLQVRDYNFGGGAEAKLESGFNVGFASIDFVGYYYWISTYVGAAGNNYIGIFRPRVTVKLLKDFNLGFEQQWYTTDRYTKDFGNFHSVRSEQRAYVMFNFGNLKLK